MLTDLVQSEQQQEEWDHELIDVLTDLATDGTGAVGATATVVTGTTRTTIGAIDTRVNDAKEQGHVQVQTESTDEVQGQKHQEKWDQELIDVLTDLATRSLADQEQLEQELEKQFSEIELAKGGHSGTITKLTEDLSTLKLGGRCQNREGKIMAILRGVEKMVIGGKQKELI